MKPWVNEPTPIVDRSLATGYAGAPVVGVSRDLERRLRHAEGLLSKMITPLPVRVPNGVYAYVVEYNADDVERIRAHLAAAELEDKK